MDNSIKNPINKKSIFLVLIVAILAISFVLSIDGPEKIWQSLKTASLFWLIIAIFIYLVSWFIEALTLHLLVTKNLIQSYKLSNSIGLAIIGRLFDNLTPSATGGQPFQAWRLSKDGAEIGKTLSVLAFRFLAYMTTMVMCFISIIVINWSDIATWSKAQIASIIIGLILNLISTIFVITAVAAPKLLKKIVNFGFNLLIKLHLLKNKSAQNKIYTEIDKFHNGFFEIIKNKFNGFVIFAISFLQIIIQFATAFFVFKSLGVHNVSLFAMISTSAYIWMLSAFIPLPGASIGAEGGFMLFFGNLIGNSGPVALGMIVWRFITYYLPTIIGLIYIFDFKKLKSIPLIKDLIGNKHA